MGAVDAIGDFSREMKDHCSSFFSAMEKCEDEEDRLDLEDELTRFMKKTEREVQSYKKTFPAPDFNFKGIENYVLASYNVKQEEMKAFSAFYISLYDDLEETMDWMNEMLETHDYSKTYKDIIDMNLNGMSYSINAFYYGYLGSLSLLPKSARKTHYEMAKKWKSFPNGTPLDLSQEEYEQFQMNEINRYQEEISKYGEQVNYEERRVNELEKQIEELDKKMEGYGMGATNN